MTWNGTRQPRQEPSPELQGWQQPGRSRCGQGHSAQRQEAEQGSGRKKAIARAHHEAVEQEGASKVDRPRRAALCYVLPAASASGNSLRCGVKISDCDLNESRQHPEERLQHQNGTEDEKAERPMLGGGEGRP